MLVLLQEPKTSSYAECIALRGVRNSFRLIISYLECSNTKWDSFRIIISYLEHSNTTWNSFRIIIFYLESSNTKLNSFRIIIFYLESSNTKWNSSSSFYSASINVHLVMFFMFPHRPTPISRFWDNTHNLLVDRLKLKLNSKIFP